MGKKGGRGKEGLVRCEKCGRQVRRDKAVYIDKPMLTNPLEIHQVAERETYRRAIFREVCYCISCGKHNRIFEKKKQQNERRRERERENPTNFAANRGSGHGPRPRDAYRPSLPAASKPVPVAQAPPVQEQVEEEVPAERQEQSQ
jgi:ribosomal protein S26